MLKKEVETRVRVEGSPMGRGVGNIDPNQRTSYRTPGVLWDLSIGARKKKCQQREAYRQKKRRKKVHQAAKCHTGGRAFDKTPKKTVLLLGKKTARSMLAKKQIVGGNKSMGKSSSRVKKKLGKGERKTQSQSWASGYRGGEKVRHGMAGG